MTFTTRPELAGTFGMVTSTHWLASAVGMKILEAGGNAFDAAVATGFVLNVVEPQLNGPLGDMPALIWPAGAEAPQMICGQGSAPAGATVAHYRSEGLVQIPDAGLLSTVVPGAFDAWMRILRDHGTLSLRTVLEPALQYAAHGYPMLAITADVIARHADFFRTEWPSSAAVWLPHDTAPRAGALFANPALAGFWTRLLQEAETKGPREAQIEAARQAFYQGFVAEAIDSYLSEACVMDGTGTRRKGVLTGQDMATWQATVEPALSGDYQGWQLWKGGFWTQGPVMLQALNTLSHTAIADTGPQDPEFVHLAVEALKLAFADREAYYGDPTHADIPTETLLSAGYACDRAALIGPWAARSLRAGDIPGFEAQAQGFADRVAAYGAGQRSAAPPDQREGDTVHLDVVDRWGNMVSATPSGGWLQSNPVVPGLGVPLNTRAQMFWLEDGLPTTLAPGRRPRTTLSPSMARGPDGRRLAFGTPGGDSQDQWQLVFLLHLIHHRMSLQEAIDAPLILSAHLQSSFYPRAVKPAALQIEPGFGAATIETLRARGHQIEVTAPWALGRLTAVSQETDGVLRAGATPRLMQAYAAGR